MNSHRRHQQGQITLHIYDTGQEIPIGCIHQQSTYHASNNKTSRGLVMGID